MRLTDGMQAQLALKNNEVCYRADDLPPVCDALVIMLILDYDHNHLYPATLALPDLVRRINDTWACKRIHVQ
ncbi:uncharacterized protein PHACADRAFT_190936 [Phanerochaete carnosa HHB-10118-sp]|uniref:Uncharacterized protein n=1 Tax=Phanerochaete carnosa (strain HHB-10118-sp) TaxID=650164 RepID=K5WCQ6_PHACS|nr:uncharacterized protein PHACADRAFT_190936 [Phanerochaete carnosa HHB-10118-sp]EKM61748.1 hypothetical protein PHACADRAFT_190936 [Phanerochaete carnosa HHB-10118-sp]